MSAHVQYVGAVVEAYTPHGEWLTDLLRLDERHGLREFILSALGKFIAAHNELVSDLNDFEARLEATQSSEDRDLLQALIRDTAEELEQLGRHIERLTGEPVN